LDWVDCLDKSSADERIDFAQGVELAKAAGKFGGRKVDTAMHERMALRSGNKKIAETAKLAGCWPSQVKRVWALHLEKQCEMRLKSLSTPA